MCVCRILRVFCRIDRVFCLFFWGYSCAVCIPRAFCLFSQCFFACLILRVFVLSFSYFEFGCLPCDVLSYFWAFFDISFPSFFCVISYLLGVLRFVVSLEGFVVAIEWDAAPLGIQHNALGI